VPIILAVLICLALLTLWGLGPALWLMPSENRLGHRLAVAAALGYALLAIVGLPLTRYVGPVHLWAWPVTILAIAASLALAALAWRQQHAELAFDFHLTTSGVTIACLVGCGVVLTVPLVRGIQYAVFRSNPSDAFLYMSIAETLRSVGWNTIQQGTTFTWANLDGITRLAQLSPTALFTARDFALPLLLNKMVILAWAAEVSGQIIPNLYLAHHLLALCIALPLAFLIGEWLYLPRWQVLLGSAAIVLGFWARFVLDTDAGYEISVLPMTLLFVVAWIQFERLPASAFSRARFLMALAAAAIAALYIPVALVLGLAVLIYAVLGLAQRTLSWVAAARYAITLALVVLILGLSGQLDFLVRGWLNLAERASGERLFPATALNLIKQDGLAAVWGLPPSILWRSRSLWIRWPLDQLAAGLGLLFTAVLVGGVLLAMRKTANSSQRIIFAVLAGGVFVALVELATNNDRSAGKAVTYIYPFLTLGLLAALGLASRVLTLPEQRWANVIVGVWLIGVCLGGSYLALRRVPDFLDAPDKSEQYDLTPITRYLDRAKPGLLLVDIPRDSAWMFAYYSEFVFDRYPAYFQSGLVVDNGVQYQNLWLSPMGPAPDFAVVAKRADYIGPAHLGALVAETPDLALYKIDAANLSAFQSYEADYRQKQSALPWFPSLKH